MINRQDIAFSLILVSRKPSEDSEAFASLFLKYPFGLSAKETA